MKTLALHKLNAKQREAVEHTQGPLLILAGAGSGKTSTMAYRMAYLIASKPILPHHILGLSFTNKAASELKDRVKKILKNETHHSGQGLVVGTFHSLCVLLLREYSKFLGFQRNFTILDTSDQRSMCRALIQQIQIDDTALDVDVLLSIFSQIKNQFLPPSYREDFIARNKWIGPELASIVHDIFERYQQQTRAWNALDFDDLIFFTAQLLKEHPVVKEQVQQRFQHILVDEYQDTNPAQFEILKLLTSGHQNIIAVGDDDQSIYSWRGAQPALILQFKDTFSDAKIIALEQNYRSTGHILKAANHVIAHNTKRFPKNLWSHLGDGELIQSYVAEQEHEESEFVARTIHELTTEQGFQYSDIAVLYRSNTQSRSFEEILRMHAIPYQVIGGMSFLDRKEVKDTLCYLKLLVNPHEDAALRRVMNYPPRGVGAKSLDHIGKQAFAASKSLYTILSDTSEWIALMDVLPAAAMKGVEQFMDLLQRGRQLLRQATSLEALSLAVKNFIEMTQIKSALEQQKEDAKIFAKKWDSVQEIAHALGRFTPKNSDAFQALEVLGSFLEKMALLDQLDDMKKDAPTTQNVTLMTLHSAKGLEYGVVFMVGLEEGLLPHQRTIDEGGELSEERRLCYVGITRAKRKLFLTRAKTRIRYGKKVPRTPSRFLLEIPENLLQQSSITQPAHTPDDDFLLEMLNSLKDSMQT